VWRTVRNAVWPTLRTAGRLTRRTAGQLTRRTAGLLTRRTAGRLTRRTAHRLTRGRVGGVAARYGSRFTGGGIQRVTRKRAFVSRKVSSGGAAVGARLGAPDGPKARHGLAVKRKRGRRRVG